MSAAAPVHSTEPVPAPSIVARATQPVSVMIATVVSGAPSTVPVTVTSASWVARSVSPGPAAVPSPSAAVSETVTALDSAM